MAYNYKLIAFGLALLTAAGCTSESFLLRKTRKQKLINNIQVALLESVEAEKSAVLATTDEESVNLSTEAQQSTARINALRTELEGIIFADERPNEIEKMKAFDAAWAQFEDVDKRLLALAVANTNLKAARLSAREGLAFLNRFVDTLAEMQRASEKPETIRALSSTSVAALRVQTLLALHIPSSEDAEMTRLEEQIQMLHDEVDRNLSSVRASSPAEQIATVSQLWVEYQRILADVLRLSRENSNVISFDVSIHEKRLVTKKCLAALSELLAEVESGPRPTR
jgi:hypothetical protein